MTPKVGIDSYGGRMSDAMQAGNGSGDAACSAAMLSLPTPCALLNRSGRVVSLNAAWSARPAGELPASGDNFLDWARACSPAAERDLREVLAGARAACDRDLPDDAKVHRPFRMLASRGGDGSVLVMLVELRARAGDQDAGDQRLRRIVESAMDGIITIDEEQKVVMFNGAAERIFGVPASEAIGNPVTRFIPSRFRDGHAAHVRTFARTGVSSRSMGNLGTVSGLRADGTEFAIEASISQATVGSQQLYTVILRDVSERKRLEAQLLQAQKMEGVGRLAGGIAHDFNNLLMAIFNYLALASRRLGPDHAVTPSISQAQRAAERAADLTRQLLTFARKQAVDLRVLCPREVAAGLTPMLLRLIGEDVDLRTAFAPDTGNVRADPAQLEQVLVNLAVNARDAMPNGGTLTIETHNVSLDENYCRSRIDVTPGDHVVLAVTDTGTGMTPEVQAKLFEPFFTTKPPGKGTGLGLATCHGIVKRCGGHIGVYSELGRGTSVRVYLPRVLSELSQRIEAAVPQAAPRGTATILLAEDSSLVRELVAEELRRAGYTVLTAASGPEALRLVETFGKPIDLLLTDVVMPEMSGVQLAEALTTKLDPAIIYMSGYTEETISHHGVDPQRVAFIAKPFMTDTLLHLIDRVLHAKAKG